MSKPKHGATFLFKYPVSEGWTLKAFCYVYEYKDHQYNVYKHINGYSEQPMYKQHQHEQAKIDDLLSRPKQEYNGENEKALEDFFKLMQGE